MLTALYSHCKLLNVSGRTDISCQQGKQNCAHTGGADKSLARPTSRCILFDGENISFDANLVIYIYIYINIYRVSQEECEILRESVP